MMISDGCTRLETKLSLAKVRSELDLLFYHAFSNRSFSDLLSSVLSPEDLEDQITNHRKRHVDVLLGRFSDDADENGDSVEEDDDVDQMDE
jgi:hypothetical protein